jgi:hypothetical protein
VYIFSDPLIDAGLVQYIYRNIRIDADYSTDWLSTFMGNYVSTIMIYSDEQLTNRHVNEEQ